MLYLEDFLELIESFPQDLKLRLNDIKDLDIQVQTETDKIETRVDAFFSQCKKQKTDWKTENFENIKKDYLKLLETADDKLQIANQLNDLIDKYLKKLDQEIHKFKLELEADHAGITSKLEKTVSTQNQNEVYNEDVFNSLIDDKSHLYDQIDTYTNIYSPLNLNDSNTFQFNPHSFNHSQSLTQQHFLKSQLSSNLLRTSSISSNMSTTQAIAPGTLSSNTGDVIFKKSASAYKRPATHIRSGSTIMDSVSNVNKELTVHHRHRTKKVKMEKYDEDLEDEEYYDDETNEGSVGQTGLDEIDSSAASDGGDSSSITNDKQFKEDINEDPSEEQRYCLCKDVSYGDMILCDNRRCETQWFHFTCVGLNAAPKGKWYCPACMNIKKKKKEKQQQQLGTNLVQNSNGQIINSTSTINNHSNNSNESKLTTNDLYNDDFDFKFQMPKSSNTSKHQKQDQTFQQQQNDNNNF